VKVLATVIIFSVLGSGAALAKLTPTEQLHSSQREFLSDATTDVSSARTTLESNYFQAPPEQPTATRKLFPCQLNIFAKTRLAQTCN
jgi:hypothetical protein